jgi:hypothetical protein
VTEFVRSVDPVTGNFLQGTYAAPESEVPLPNNLPASYRYEIGAPVGTPVDFGTVAPAFGQAGGVEAYFSKAVANTQIPPTPVLKLPDE